MFVYSKYQIDEAQDPNNDIEDDLVLFSMEVREGQGTVSSVSTFDNETDFPRHKMTFSEGSKYAVLMPDSSLGSLYSNDDKFEFSHALEDIAEAMLNSNYLPPDLFGRGADDDARRIVFEEMGIEDAGVDRDEHYRNVLREIAGMEKVEGAVKEKEMKRRADELQENHTYSELRTMASDMGIDDARQKMDVLAEWIAEHENDSAEE